ncbi:MAG: carboxymuconolactone decarboxylase family protein [Pseudomonadota bacterium]
MNRLTPVADADASPQTAEIFNAVTSKVGMVPNVYRVVGASSAALGAFLGFNEGLGAGRFDVKTREAIALAVAGANNCDYCASAHSAISKNLKVDDAEITARLRGGSSDARLDAILKFAVALVDKKGFATDADLAAAREAGLDQTDIVEIIALTVANIFTNYVNHVADTEIDFPEVKAQAA